MFGRNKNKNTDQAQLSKGTLQDLEIQDPKAKNSNANLKAKKQDKQKEPRKKISKVFKEMFSELKKVSWTPFKKALVQTGVVLVVVLVFLLVIGAFDASLSQLFKLVIGRK